LELRQSPAGRARRVAVLRAARLFAGLIVEVDCGH
jgi:hypothetical protein